MRDKTFSHEDQAFVERLDQAAQSHMAWTRRVLRCALLRTSPGDDVLADDAHDRCDFGLWFRRNRERFDIIDAHTTLHLEAHHQRMHVAVRSICRGVLAGAAGDPSMLEEFERTQTAVVADLAHLKTEFLSHSARIDALTGLPLRYGLEEDFLRYCASAQRHGERVVAMLLDVDHFKRVNDTHGHAVGDLALRHVADVLRSRCRSGELLFRFGGEEFLALQQVPDAGAAGHAAQRLLQGLRDAAMPLPDSGTLGLTMSAGLAESGRDESMASVVDRADKALYQAKAAGRDCWRWAREPD
ncbi:diguanylate cyclase [Comamonadaceae bacterium G21597-S1]|nr:diguanylate cyclase [Comamonadaceae bacterium G21597-S1]